MTDQEARYLQALSMTGEFKHAGDRLTIWYDDGKGVLNFVRDSGTVAPEETAGPGTATPGVIEETPGPTELTAGSWPENYIDDRSGPVELLQQITLLVHELNKRVVSKPVMARLEAEAKAMATFASTSIEGNPLSLTEVKRLLKKRPDQVNESEREVLNYNLVLAELNKKPERAFSRDLILAVHAGVTAGLLPAHQSGRFRQVPVVVHNPRTGDVIYLPPDHKEVAALVDHLIDFVAANRGVLDPVLLAGLIQKQLVIIHPFVDGNGRTTRLVTKGVLAGLGLDTFNLFSFENYYNQNVSRYFEKNGVSSCARGEGEQLTIAGPNPSSERQDTLNSPTKALKLAQHLQR